MFFIVVSIIIPVLCMPGYQSVLESKGINDPSLAFSLFKTTILFAAALKLFLVSWVNDLIYYGMICFFTVMALFFFFYARISLGVSKKSLRNNKKFPQETNYTMCAFKMLAWSAASIIFDFVLLQSWTFEDPSEVYYIIIVVVILASLFLILSAKALIRIDRLKYPSIRSLKALSNNNSPIVLLRSFKIDANPLINGKVFDETICENLDLYNNPIISLANPDDILPSGGSLKIQSKDSEWKEVIKEVLKNCRAVILVEGLSDGLHWEISKLKEYIEPSQLFVMIPSNNFRELAWCVSDESGSGLFAIHRNIERYMSLISIGNRRDTKKILNAVWEDFTSRLNQYGIHTPEAFPGSDSLLFFDENWNSTKQSTIRGTKNMLDYIVSRTGSFNQSQFDYKQLGEKIASYEVNGFLSQEDVAPFKKVVGKCNKIGRIAALVFLACFVLVMVLSFW